MMKKRVLLLTAAMALVLIGIVSVRGGADLTAIYCDRACNGVCSSKGWLANPKPCTTSEDPDCPNPALVVCCGDYVCEGDENKDNCQHDCELPPFLEDVDCNGKNNWRLTGDFDAVFIMDQPKVTRLGHRDIRYIAPKNPFNATTYVYFSGNKTIVLGFQPARGEKVYLNSNQINGYNCGHETEPHNEYRNCYNLNFLGGKWNLLRIEAASGYALTVKFSDAADYMCAMTKEGDKSKSLCGAAGGNWLFETIAEDSGANNYCCGNDANDLGALNIDNAWLCYKDEDGAWKWIDAGSYKFEIISAGNNDYASNSQRWYRCGTDVSVNGILPGYGDKTKNALKFLCYNEGDKNVFAECCIGAGPGEDTNVHGIGCYNDGYKGAVEDTAYNNPEKLRLIGEPTTLLNATALLSFEYSPAGADVGYKNIQIIDFLVPISDWTGYDSFEFFAKLENPKEYDIIIMAGAEELTGTLENDYTQLFRGSLADYTAGSYNEWRHIVIPVDEIDDTDKVSQVVFYTNVTRFGFAETAKVYLKRFFLRNADARYCTDAYISSWTDNLDTKIESKYDRDTLACDSFPAYKWTGSKCCGDDNDESYKDSLAGCWHNNVLENNSAAENVLFYNGNYYGCNAEHSSLIEHEADFCDAIGNYFCDTDGWSDEFSGTDSSLRGALSSVPEEIIPLVPKQASCCAANYCWNGTECIEGMEGRTDDVYNLSGYTYRCVYGSWQQAIMKWDWNNDKSGYCPYEEQCLVDKNGNVSSNNKPWMYRISSPICINDSQFIEDHYCNGGDWTTRTRMLASTMLNVEVTSDDFTLYCDYYTRSLADYAYNTPSVERYLAGDAKTAGGLQTKERQCFSYDADCVNNFCVMKYEDNGGQKTAFGVSLNKPIDDVSYSFLEALNLDRTYCNILGGNGPYFKCGNAKIVWYNPDLNSVIYGKNEISVPEGRNLIKEIGNLFTMLFGWIWGQHSTAPAGEGIDISLIDTAYNTLYLQKKGDKEVYAVMEQAGDKTLITVDYTNFYTNICDAVRRMAEHTPYNATECNETNGHHVVYSNYPAIWQELTSKLRIS